MGIVEACHEKVFGKCWACGRNINYGSIEKFVILVVWKGHCLGICMVFVAKKRVPFEKVEKCVVSKKSCSLREGSRVSIDPHKQMFLYSL
jgi:hypothetical protein